MRAHKIADPPIISNGSSTEPQPGADELSSVSSGSLVFLFSFYSFLVLFLNRSFFEVFMELIIPENNQSGIPLTALTPSQ